LGVFVCACKNAAPHSAKASDFLVSEKAARERLSLPIYPELTNRQVQRITDVIKDFFKNY
jgi:dTDP-4-amino-4,6-dideoxygalactose transaminase